MRTREWWYFAIIGISCIIALALRVWYLPLVTFSLLEGSFTIVELARAHADVVEAEAREQAPAATLGDLHAFPERPATSFVHERAA